MEDTLTSCWLCLKEAEGRGEEERALGLGEEERGGGEDELGLKEEVGEEGEREGLEEEEEEEEGRGGEVTALDFTEEEGEMEGEREGLEEEEGLGGASTPIDCIGGLIITLDKPTEGGDSCGWEKGRGGDTPACLEMTGLLLLPAGEGRWDTVLVCPQ